MRPAIHADDPEVGSDDVDAERRMFDEVEQHLLLRPEPPDIGVRCPPLKVAHGLAADQPLEVTAHASAADFRKRCAAPSMTCGG